MPDTDAEPPTRHEPPEKAIFLAALEIADPGVRARFLAEKCGGDEALRARVAQLLAFDEDGDTAFLEPSDSALAEALAADAPPMPEVGAAIRYFGDYELEEVIARGAMGVVYRARQTSLKRTVAVKMIRGALLASEADVRRFQLEAEAGARLDHPNIVPIYEVGEFQGQHYFSMKLIPGGTLADAMPALGRDPRRAAEVVAKVARAVHAAHQRGILHRDIKPGNILIDESGEPQVTDFGLAKQIDAEDTLTLSGQILGTPFYMAPEQGGGGSKAQTTASDIYSLGAVLYEILAGRPPFRGGTILETLRLAKEEPAPPLPKAVDRDLATIAAKCLEKAPASRYASAEALAADLDRWRRGEPIHARQATPLERAAKWARRKPVHAALLGTATLLLATLGVGGPIVAARQKALAEAEGQARGKAEAAQKAEAEARQVAEDRADQIAANLYVAEMSLAQQANREPGGWGRLVDLLGKWVPAPGEVDRRGWEWFFLRAEAERYAGGFPVGESPRGMRGIPGSTSRLAIAYPGSLAIWEDGRSIAQIHADGIGELLCFAFSPDGSKVAAGGVNGAIQMRDVPSGTLLREFKAAGNVTSIDWSETGQIAAWIARSGPVLLDAERLEPASIGFEDIGGVTGKGTIRFSPAGDLLAAVHASYLYLWRASDGKRIYRLRNPEFYHLSVEWSPGGEYLALGLGGGNGGNEVRQAKSGGVLYRLPGRGSLALSWSPDGSRLAGANQSTGATIWDVESETATALLNGHRGGLVGVQWSGDGNEITTLGEDSFVKRWDARTAERGAAAASRLTRAYSLAWHPGGEKLAIGAAGGFGIMDIATGKSEWHKQGTSAFHVRWDLAGDTLFANIGAKICRWNPATGGLRVIGEIGAMPANGLDLSPGGEAIAATERGKNPYLWRLESGAAPSRLPLPDSFGLGPGYAIRYSPRGDLIATGTLTTLFLCDAQTGEVRHSFEVGHVTDLAWHPGGNRIAVTADAVITILTETPAGWQTGWLAGHTEAVTALDWSPDGCRLASGSGDQTARIWDVESQHCTLVLAAHSAYLHCVRWSPDGQILATAGADGNVHLWDARKGFARKEAPLP